jgi:hypothetical protein
VVRPLSQNPFVGLTATELLQLRTTWLLVLGQIASGGVSYAFPGRSFTRADLDTVKDTLAEIRAAIDYLNASGKQMVQAVIDTQRRFSG